MGFETFIGIAVAVIAAIAGASGWVIFAAPAKQKQKQISSVPKITQRQLSQQQIAG